MRKVKAVSLDEESEEILEELKSNYPNIQLSSFIRDKLKEELDKALEEEKNNKEGTIIYMLTECFGIKEQSILDNILKEWKQIIRQREYKILNGNSIRSQVKRSLWIGEQAMKYGYQYITIEQRRNIAKEILEEEKRNNAQSQNN